MGRFFITIVERLDVFILKPGGIFISSVSSDLLICIPSGDTIYTHAEYNQ